MRRLIPQVIAILLCVSVSLLASTPTGVTMRRAVGDFHAVTEAAFAASYAETKDADASTHGLAVNPKVAGERSAAAETTFRGETGYYTVQLNAVAEEDGESVYELVVDGRNLGRRTNARVQEKRVPQAHTWENVRLAGDARVRVLFAGRSNQLHPEGASFAWSRGRWRSLEFIPKSSTP